jgi:hypothetical protein
MFRFMIHSHFELYKEKKSKGDSQKNEDEVTL